MATGKLFGLSKTRLATEEMLWMQSKNKLERKEEEV